MIRRRKYKDEEQNKNDRWLVSYADFITLLFAFFVVMYSVSSVNEGKYRVLSDSITSAFELSQDGISVQLESPLKPPIIEHDITINNQPHVLIKNNYPNNWSGILANEKAKDSLNRIAARVENSLAKLINKNLVYVKKNDLWIEVEIKSSILFSSGSSYLSDNSRPLLKELAKVLNQYGNQIQVEGFTDNIPIQTSEFPSNWELSASRAASVVRLLSREGVDPARMSAVGYGEFRPMASNSTPLGRSKNRRVKIIILSNSFSTEASDSR
jgi:chemotaxis protein MotB